MSDKLINMEGMVLPGWPFTRFVLLLLLRNTYNYIETELKLHGPNGSAQISTQSLVLKPESLGN